MRDCGGVLQYLVVTVANVADVFIKSNTLPIFMKQNIIIGALLLIIGIAIGLLCRSKDVERIVDVQRDTTFLVDTHVIEKPVLVDRHTTDSLLIAIRDTIRIRDTLYISLPKEVKIYAEKDYYAEVSGYEPSLDYLEVYPTTQFIKETQTVTRCNALTLGIEPSYLNTFSIPIYLEYERMLHKNVGIYGQFQYDLQTRLFGFGLGAKISIGW